MNLFLVQNALVSYHFGIYEKPFRLSVVRTTDKHKNEMTNLSQTFPWMFSALNISINIQAIQPFLILCKIHGFGW